MTLDLTLGGLITLAWVLTTVACVVMGVLVVAVKSERHLGQRARSAGWRRCAPTCCSSRPARTPRTARRWRG